MFDQSAHLYLFILCASSECSGETARTVCSMRGSRGEDRGSGPPPLKNHKNIGFLSNTGLGPLKNDKATKPAFNVGARSALQRNAI